MQHESERVLGPRWSAKELRTFYILLKAHGQQWDKLEERLPRRSGAMVRALFEMHRGYLSLPEASVEGFCAIMRDHYANLDELQNLNQKKLQKQSEADAVQVKTEAAPDETTARSRKKRRLEKLLDDEQLATLRIRTEEDLERREEEQQVLRKKRRARKKSMTPMRSRAWLPREGEGDRTGLAKVQGDRFELPWAHWFYSYVDVDFFQHNEFIECLTKMGLGKITAAARLIWSSVRASMGHPRRLSPLFFTQEKAKLETYRAVKRRLDPNYQPNGTWPYKCSVPLQPGVSVMVWMEEMRCFHLGKVAKFNSSEGVCHVVCDGYAEDEACLACSLDNIMVLDFSPWSRRDESADTEPKLTATTLLRRENSFRGDMSSLTPPKSINSIDNRCRDEKIRAVLTVKSLLHRKEQIVSALANLNKRVAEQQQQLRQQNAMTSSLWTTPTAFSSAAVKDLAWTNSREKALVQQQHAWLAANLDVTKSYLMSALLSLESFSAANPGWSDVVPEGTEAAALSGDVMPPTDTLSVEQMRWAIDFLSSSQDKAATVVAASALGVTKNGSASVTSETSSREGVEGNTMHLIANCVTLMSVLHRRGAAAPGVPQVVTQTLVDRLLELLKPSHEGNMDLYAELQTAAESAQLQMAMRPPANARD